MRRHLTWPLVAAILLAACTASDDDGSGPEAEVAPEDERQVEPDAEPDAEATPEAEEPAGLAARYRAVDGAIQTADGHVLWLRGVNYSGQAKGATDHLVPLGAAEAQALLADGVDSLRLLTFWKAITPDAPGEVDAAYLAAFAERLAAADAAGIRVVVDMHQDLWGPPFAGHGAPEWACPAEITEGYEPSSPWWVNYTKPQVMGCFDNFYESDELQDAFAAAWAAVAEVACPYANVVGFDLLNEPFPGSGLGNAAFDTEVLLPVYERAIAAIDRVCPDRLYFLEPSAAFTMGLASWIEVPERLRGRAVLAPHFYPPEVHEPGAEGYDGDRAALVAELTDLWGPYLDDGLPVWCGEFGGITSNPAFREYMEDLHLTFLELGVTSALWDHYAGDGGFAFLDADGVRKPEFETTYRVPGPTRLPTAPTAWTPDWAAGTLDFTVECAAGKGVTVLLPRAGDACTAAPEGVLEAVPAGPGFVSAACRQTARVTITCATGR